MRIRNETRILLGSLTAAFLVSACSPATIHTESNFLGTLIIECGDQRDKCVRSLSALDGIDVFKQQNILAIDEIAGVVPPELEKIVEEIQIEEKIQIGQIMITPHTKFPECTGACGGLAASGKIHAGETLQHAPPEFVDWLRTNTIGDDVFQQTINQAKIAVNLTAGKRDVFATVFDHVNQIHYPVFQYVATNQHTEMISSEVWKTAADTKFTNGIPQLADEQLSNEALRIINLNRTNAGKAAEIAVALDFAHGQPFDTLVANTLFEPAESVVAALVKDSEFAITMLENNIGQSVANLTYGMNHYHATTEFKIIADMNHIPELQETVRQLNLRPEFQKMINDQAWLGKVEIHIKGIDNPFVLRQSREVLSQISLPDQVAQLVETAKPARSVKEASLLEELKANKNVVKVETTDELVAQVDKRLPGYLLTSDGKIKAISVEGNKLSKFLELGARESKILNNILKVGGNILKVADIAANFYIFFDQAANILQLKSMIPAQQLIEEPILLSDLISKTNTDMHVELLAGSGLGLKIKAQATQGESVLGSANLLGTRESAYGKEMSAYEIVLKDPNESITGDWLNTGIIVYANDFTASDPHVKEIHYFSTESNEEIVFRWNDHPDENPNMAKYEKISGPDHLSYFVDIKWSNGNIYKLPFQMTFEGKQNIETHRPVKAN